MPSVINRLILALLIKQDHWNIMLIRQKLRKSPVYENKLGIKAL